MTEGSNHFPGNGSDEELESAAVLGAAAIQRLIADRNHLRSEVAAAKVAQERLHQSTSNSEKPFCRCYSNSMSRCGKQSPDDRRVILPKRRTPQSSSTPMACLLPLDQSGLMEPMGAIMDMSFRSSLKDRVGVRPESPLP